MAALFITTAKEDVRRSSIKTEKLTYMVEDGEGRSGKTRKGLSFKSFYVTSRT